jgi:protein SCO1/2
LRHWLAALLGALAWPGVPFCQAAELPADSLYQLRAALTTQDGIPAGFDLYRGHPTVVSMFYGSCPAYCPMLITAVQVYESHLDETSRARLRVLLVSFDASRDDPQRLAALSRLHRADPQRWTFACAAEPDARRIATLLGLHYRRLEDGSFDHSQVVTLLDGEGRVVASTTRLIGDSAFEAKLRAVTDSRGRERPRGDPDVVVEEFSNVRCERAARDVPCDRDPLDRLYSGRRAAWRAGQPVHPVARG